MLWRNNISTCPSGASARESLLRNFVPKLTRINGRPFFQTVLVGIVLFLNPGTYLAITGLGAGGKQPELVGIVNDANVVLYTLFGASAVVGGGLVNKIGPRFSLMLGVTGYPVYCGSLWFA